MKKNYYKESIRETSNKTTDYLIEKINIINNDIILDFGSGSGSLGKKIKENNKKHIILGIDIDEGVNDIKNYDFYEKLGIGDLQKLSVKDILGDYDGNINKIISLDTFEHILNPLNVLNKLKDSLVKDGLIYIQVPGPFPKIIWDDYTHIRGFTQNALERLVLDSGLEIVEIGKTGGIPLFGKLGLSEKLKHKIINIPILGKPFITGFYVIGKKK